MQIFKISFAFVHHLYLLILFFIKAFLIKISTPNEDRRRYKLVLNTSFIARGFIKAFGISLKVNNPERLHVLQERNHLIIANHVSYLDIIVLSSIYPLVYITSVEMGENPFLGDITKLGGCLFTNRKKVTTLPKEIENFADALKRGFNVVLFPEGTSTNGETIREFRKSLFQIAVHAKVPVLPICIRYTAIDGKRIDASTRDLVCWYGDMSFAPHFSKLLGRTISAEVNVLEPISWSDTNTRQQLSDETYRALFTCFHSYD